MIPEKSSSQNSGRLIEYLSQCLNTERSVASFDLCRDSQCSWLVNKIRKKVRGRRYVKLLDMGCGNLRLLNAISKNPLLKNVVRYCGADIAAPIIPNNANLEYEYFPVKMARQQDIRYYDIVVIMNVLHEISLLEIVENIESARRLLKDDGVLYVVDMGILPKGEHNALPLYPWDLKDIFPESRDGSYFSKSGIPVVALAIEKKDIPFYCISVSVFYNLIRRKRDSYSLAACYIPSKEQHPEVRTYLNHLSLGVDNVYNFAYLMNLSGTANNRLIEFHVEEEKISKDAVNDAAIAVLKFFFKYRKASPTWKDMYDLVCFEHGYLPLTVAVLHMVSECDGFFCKPLYDGASRMTATKRLAKFEDRYDYADITKNGIDAIICFCDGRPFLS